MIIYEQDVTGSDRREVRMPGHHSRCIRVPILLHTLRSWLFQDVSMIVDNPLYGQRDSTDLV